MKTIEQMVQQEICCCLSSLISTLAGGDAHPGTDLSALCDQALELASPVPDYEEAAIQDGWKHVGTESDRCMVFSKGTSITGKDTIRASTWGELCDLQGLEPIDSEVYEHWAVSGWLAEKLLAHGEKVDTDFAAMNVWARQTTGQMISADGVIARIYADMMRA